VPVANFRRPGVAVISRRRSGEDVAGVCPYAKTGPDNWLYGSTATARRNNLNGEVLAKLLSTKRFMCLIDLAGRVHRPADGPDSFLARPDSDLLEQVRTGSLRGDRVAGGERSADLPEHPTVKGSAMATRCVLDLCGLCAGGGPDAMSRLYLEIKSGAATRR